MEQQEHRLIKLWQYELQLIFRTTNLHITGAWRLANDSTIEAHKAQAEALSGPVLHSWFPVDALRSFATLNQILAGKMPPIDWRSFLFPVGSLELRDSLSNHFVLCHLAIGVTGPKDLSSGIWRVPEHLSSLVSMEDRIDDDMRMTFVVRQSDQVIPVAVVEVAFSPKFIELSVINCEMCENSKATVYCSADRAHLCGECDRNHHAISQLFSKHKRVPVEQSPMQFGACPDHPNERLECMCFECMDLVCSLCVLMGRHAAKSCKEHRLVSTVESFKSAMMRTSPADVDAKEAEKKLKATLDSRHQELTDVYVNFDALQQLLNRVLESCCTSIDMIQKRRVGYLQALRRQLLSQLLSIEWFESHLAHARLALPPGDFLRARDRHVLLIRHLFERASVDVRDVPANMLESLGIEGNLNVVLDPPETSSLLTTPHYKNFRPDSQDLDASYGRPPLGGYELVLEAPESKTGLPKTKAMHLVPTSFKQVAQGKDVKSHLPPALETSVAYGDIHYPNAEPQGSICPETRLRTIDDLIHKNLASVEFQKATEYGAPEGSYLVKELSTGERPWGNALDYIMECPVEDRHELVQAMFQLCMSLNNGSDQQLLKAAIEDELIKAGGFPGLMFSTRSVLSVIIGGILGIAQDELLYLQPLLTELLSREAGDMNNPNTLFQAMERFLQRMVQTAAQVPFFLLVIFHGLKDLGQGARFSRDTIIALIASCFLTRVVAPQMIRLAQRSFSQSALEPLPEFVSWFSRWFQKIAHFGLIEQERKRALDILPEEKFAQAMFKRVCQFAAQVLLMPPPNPRAAITSLVPGDGPAAETLFFNMLQKHWNSPIARLIMINTDKKDKE